METVKLISMKEPDVHQGIAKALDLIREGKTREYESNGTVCGRAVIVNFREFSDPTLKTRVGSEHDVKALKETFEMFHFDVIVWDTHKLKQADFDRMLREESHLVEEHKKSDCFVMVIMSHGGTDGLMEAYKGAFMLDHVLDYFKADNCPQLGGKPKIFIIQACRGSEAQEAVVVRKAAVDPPVEVLVPACSEFLIAYSQWEGYSSLKSPKYGSLFIQSLCQVLRMDFEKHDEDKDDILTLLTFVSQVVASFEITEVVRGSLKESKEQVTEDAEPFEPKDDPQKWTVLSKRHIKQSPTMVSSLTRLFYLKSKNKG